MGIFSSSDSLGPTKTHNFVSPYITAWESSGFFLSSLRRSNTACSQQSVNFLDLQRDIDSAQHSFGVSIVLDFPFPLPSPQRVTSSLF